MLGRMFYALVTLFSAASLFSGEALLRFPDIHENTIVFVSGEDIWSVPESGGAATRLTMHDGAERFPKFSPDGKLIAFTGAYDGNADIYVMNAQGGNITRVTWHPGYDEIVGWHPLKNKIIFRSGRLSYNRFSRLFLISPDGTGLEEIILHEATQGSFSPDGNKIAYNKVSREARTWKRYKGGTAQEIYVYDLTTNKEKNVSVFRGTDRIPMWIGDKIYFSSDRDRILNIYAYDTKTEQIEQLTKHTEYDVRRPSMGGNKIVYEIGGGLYVLDVNSGTTNPLTVDIPTDAPELRPYLKKVDEEVTAINLSPSGKRALLVSRGEIFSVPKKHGPTRNLSNNPGARYKNAVWSPDGKTIAYFSDTDGEYNLYLTDPLGKEKPQLLTNFKDGYRHSLRWSPNSKMLAFTDQTLTLFIIDVKSKETTTIDRAEYENVDVSLDVKPIYDFAWSPDSRFIAYSKMDESLVNKIFIYSFKEAKSYEVSSGLYNEFHPVFTTDGKHLLFISNRRMEPTYGDFEWEMVYKKIAGIYALTLQKDGQPLLPFRSDEEGMKKDDVKSEDNEVKVVIDFKGLADRTENLPLPRGNYRNLSVNESGVFYLNKDEGDFNRFEFRNIGKRDLKSFSFKERKEHIIIKDINSYKLSADGSAIIYKQDNTVGIIESSAKDSGGSPISLSDLQMWYDPMAEWQQIFNEAWRMERDFYYEPNYHGLDWLAMKDKYGSLLKKATCRQDIRFIIGELIGELNTSHSYIFGGDSKREAERVNIGLLGADYKADEKNNLYQFKKIYREPDWTSEIIPPLAEPGLNVKEGDYLLAVNGKKVTTDKNIYGYFVNMAGKQVTLTVNSKPSFKGAKDITVKPARGEYLLRYLDWIEHNRKLVDKESNGQIGYLHLPDTYTRSARQFGKYFYSQTTKQGIIVDGRFNGGGLDPVIFLRRLNNRGFTYWTRRYSHDQMSPWLGTNAHLVCITNRQAGSGGDELPYEFKKFGMGPVIGTRTWGGLVGVSMFIRLIDGGGLTAPDYRIYDTEGKWIVENEGVIPDIEVDNHPEEMARGYDAQLMKTLEILKKKIAEQPFKWPQHEPFPIDK